MGSEVGQTLEDFNKQVMPDLNTFELLTTMSKVQVMYLSMLVRVHMLHDVLYSYMVEKYGVPKDKAVMDWDRRTRDTAMGEALYADEVRFLEHARRSMDALKQMMEVENLCKCVRTNGTSTRSQAFTCMFDDSKRRSSKQIKAHLKSDMDIFNKQLLQVKAFHSYLESTKLCKEREPEKIRKMKEELKELLYGASGSTNNPAEGSAANIMTRCEESY